MTHRPTRISRWLAVFGNTGYSTLSRRTRRDRKTLLPEMLESRVLLTTQYVANHVILEIGISPEDQSSGSGPDAGDEIKLSKGIASLYPSAKLAPLGDYGLYLVSLPSNVDAMDAIERLRTLPEVKSAEPDWIGEWAAVPNDPDFNRMWGWQNTAQQVNGVTGIDDADIDADIAWDTFTGSSTTKVAIVDSGVDYLHPDLAANIWSNPGEVAGNGIDDDSNGYVDDVNGYDFGSDDADPMDFVGHGTHVAGTVGAVGNNGIGTVGVNWNSSIMALKIGTDFGGPTNSGAIAAINYAVAMGAVVSNHSYTVNPTSALQSAITNAQANGHIVVVAAGNSARNNDFSPVFPASYTQDNVVTVAATTQSDTLASFSNFGALSVDIGAPGVNIWSTTPRAGSLFYGPNYDFSDGTSMAAPAVAGAIAFLRGISPSSTYTEIINVLYQGADVIPALVGRVSTGARLNLDRSARLLSPASITISPSTVAETAGPAGASITIRKDAFPIGTDLVVDLTFDDSTEIDVPALSGGSSVTIPAGETQITLPIDILDDTLLDGTQTVTFELSLNGNSIDTDFLRVTDVETLSINVSPASVREDAGANAGTITVTRSNTDTAPPNTFAVVNNQLLEHDFQGNLVSSRDVPWPAGARPSNQSAYDVTVMQNGRVAVYNGTVDAYVSIFNPTSLVWQHIQVPGLTASANASDKGGISSVGDYVFLTDTKISGSDLFGVVRVDINTGEVTRFATKSPGYRMFIKDIFTDGIIEVNPTTGATINTLPLPPQITSNFGFNNGLAFDGTNLWFLAGPIGNDQIYKLDPDTGNVLDIHKLGGTQGWDGLAFLNGLLYVQDDFIDNRITVYNPATRRVVNTLNVGSINGINISGGLGAITGPDRLLATSTFGDTIYEINPTTGAVSNSWKTGISNAEGIATANGEIYIGAFQDGRLNVFDRSGVFQRFVDVSLSRPEGVHALGGDNILTLVPTDFQYQDVFVGLDDKIYIVDSIGTTVARFNPATLAPEDFISISEPLDALTADADGNLWGAGQDGKLYKLDSEGVVLQERLISSTSLIDIDLNITGQLLLSSEGGRIYKTNTSFSTPTSFSAGTTPTFVTQGKHQSLPAGDLIVQLSNSDSSEISIPTEIIIPVGQQSVTFPFGAVDDNLLDGTQTATVTATSVSYAEAVSDSVDVRDAETIGVNILAPQISEAAGASATQARVFRTDIDGPFTHISRQVFTNSAKQTILDSDKTTSTINVPVQTSRITDVNVGISLTHSFLSDLDIYLVSPSGTRVELVTDIVSNESTMTSTIFDDAARSGILSGSAPFTGRFRPEGELLDLNNESPTGVWTLEITDDNQEDFGELIAWTLSIETAGLAAITVNLAKTGDTNEINARTSVVIPANQSSIMIPVDAIDDTILDGTRVAGLRAGSTVFGYLFGSDNVNVLDRETLQFTVNKTTVPETAGSAAITGTLKRLNTDLGASFTVALSSSDTSELTVPATVTIPAGSSSVTFPINAIDDSVLDGTQKVTVRAVTSQYNVETNQVISVTDVEPKLVLTSGGPVTENSGSFTTTVTRQQQTDISRPVVVNLSVSAFTGLAAPISVPATVTIPAGRLSQTFVVTVKDDSLLDGTQTATILARATGITEDSAEFQITDYETLSVSINKTSIREDAGALAATGTVTRSNSDVALPLTVVLGTLGPDGKTDLSEVRVPATITIPAGARSANFEIDAINDPALDGTQVITITASEARYASGSATINVDDHEPPVVTAPAATVLNPSPTVKWNAIQNALRYDVLLQNLSTGVEQLYRNILDTSLTIAQPKAEPLGIGRYRVFVRAINQLEQPGFWSVARNFQVVTAPVFTAPKTTSVLVGGTFPEISWTAVKDADGYELIVHNLTTGRSNVISQKDLKTTSYIATEVLGSGTYRATVRAFNDSKEYGNFSTALDFTVLAAPVILTPVSGGTFDRSPNLSWTSVSGATTYDVIVSNAQTKAVVFRDRSVPGTSIRIPQDLPDATYTVQVRAQSGRFFGSLSASRVFSVGASPEITSPVADQKTGAVPTFLFTSISGAERYEIWVLNKDTNAYVIQASNVTGTSYTPTKPLPLGEYEVTIRAISFLGDITDWSDPVSFIGGASPVISSPVSNATTIGKPLIVWSAVEGANAYNVRIVNLANNSSVVLTGNLTGTSFTPSTSLAAGKYRIWVRAVSAQGHTSNWSTAVDVTVASSAASEGLTTFGSPVVASVLSTPTAELASSHAGIAVDSRSSSMRSFVAVTPTYAEHMTPSEEVTEADALAAVTDQVMAAWDISEWWSATPIALDHKDETI